MSTLSHAIRSLLRQPSFAFVAVLTLALALGASSAIFSIVYSVLLRPLPFPEPDRLAILWEKNPTAEEDQFPVAPANFLDWKTQSSVFDRIAAFDSYATGLSGTDEPQRVNFALVSSDFFPLLGIGPALGRAFSEEEAGGSNVAVLSYSSWQRFFGGDPNVLGKVVKLDGEPHQVIGVMPADFRFPDNVELWVPLKLEQDEANVRDNHYLRVVARLKPGVPLARARREMDLIAGRLAASYPETNKGLSVNVFSLEEQIVGDVRPALLTLLGAVGFVLLLASVNVSTLAVARTISRRQETMVRLALGASWKKLFVHFLAEGLAVGLCGGVLGLGFAAFAVRLLVRFWPTSLPRLEEVHIDGPMVAFTLLIALAVGVLIELVPLFLVRRIAVQGVLEERGRGQARVSGRRSREAVVAFEIALALVLLVSAGLMVRSFAHLQTIPTGFKPEGVTSLETVLPATSYPEGIQQNAFYRRILEDMRRIPGVREVAVATSIPFSSENLRFRFTIEGRPLPPSGEKPGAAYNAISPGFFRALGIPLLTGRDFTDHDREEAPGVVIISQTMADRFWPGENPLGKRMTVGREEEAREIVGVVGDAKYGDLNAPSDPRMYVPFVQHPWPLLTLVVRADSESSSVANELRNVVWAIDKEQAVSSVRTMPETLAEQVARPRLNMFLMALFATIALILATVGVYGLNSYLTAHRMGEVGVRMALGAQRMDIFKLILNQGARPVLVGTFLGLLLATWLTRLLASLLFGVSSTDFSTYLNSALILALVSLFACFIPARRAAKSEPMLVLRQE
jgi:putative ABC transport system permease protein